MKNDTQSFPCFANNIVIHACLAARQEGSAGLEGQEKYSRNKGDI